jgi:hypothetical protein
MLYVGGQSLPFLSLCLGDFRGRQADHDDVLQRRLRSPWLLRALREVWNARSWMVGYGGVKSSKEYSV